MQNLSVQEILQKRQDLLANNLSSIPIKIVKGKGCYMFNEKGERYLDMINNIAHVGHANPTVTKMAHEQMQLINTNSRHLSESLVHYAEELLATFPSELSTLFLVNSGSEATELALRIVRHVTNQKDIIVLNGAYHGNTGCAVEISPYKFAHHKHGFKPPSYVHKAPVPDVYRGKYRIPDQKRADKQLLEKISDKYAKEIENIIQYNNLHNHFCGFICESLLSCGGQIVLPPSYLKKVYEIVRGHGGLCIADEIQTGFGRVGHHWWGFQSQDVIPDIVLLGKSMGNGYPISGVVVSKKIAQAFEGSEFFSSFGGSNVSCEVGRAVLKVIKEEKLIQKAQKLESSICQTLERLRDKYEMVGDVRGMGLFWGIEIVKDKSSRNAAPEAAVWIKKRMLSRKIFISTDGLENNVLKIKPPMTIEIEDINHFAKELSAVLEELHKQPTENILQDQPPAISLTSNL